MSRPLACRLQGDLDKVHEARDKHGETLYRLFLRCQRDERRGRARRLRQRVTVNAALDDGQRDATSIALRSAPGAAR
jgi:hypothetical protein